MNPSIDTETIIDTISTNTSTNSTNTSTNSTNTNGQNVVESEPKKVCKSQNINKYCKYSIPIEFIKLLTLALIGLVFFIPTDSLLFTVVVSTIFGSGYYIFAETQPQLMMVLNILVKYQTTKISKRFRNYFAKFKWLNEPFIDYRLSSLRDDENYSFVKYFDLKESSALKNKVHIYMFHNKHRSTDLIIFKDENDQDITDKIEPYLGPLQNFHGTVFTPSDFNHKKIKVFRDGEINLSKTFEENEPIVLV